MAEPHSEKEVIMSSDEPVILHTSIGDFELEETVEYINGGRSYFYIGGDTAIILDDGICEAPIDGPVFEYSQITLKQNEYMAKYDKVFRFLEGDGEAMELCLNSTDSPAAEPDRPSGDRADFADATPLERYFEDRFISVFGPDSAKYLWKEYGFTDQQGSVRYLDYLVKTENGDIAVEENGVSYHHPQITGPQRYRKQLIKQNSCALAGIKLYRFSTEDCQFTERFEDDIRAYFGKTTEGFKESGLVVDRPFRLYEHQENTLEEMAKQRAEGLKSFLVVFPTASGKSKIVEEDMLRFAKENGGLRALVLVPNTAIKEDWHNRVQASLKEYEGAIEVRSFMYMTLHYEEFAPDFFDYIVVDEAHHAVAPGLKRTIQYFDPKFLVGLTATDERPDKKKLETVFGSYRVGLSLQDAMEQGIVARANVFRVETNIDLSKVRINGKEYVNADLEKSIRVTSRNELIADVLKEYFCEGEVAQRQGIVFCVSVKHAQEMERILNEAGIPAKAYSSKSKDPQGIMRDFREKKIRFLCTCQMISEGWDYPELGILVMARPTLSKVLYLQQLGRGLRKTATKHNVFVIDVVDEYGSAVMPCSMHTIFKNPYYVPFGDIANRDYCPGEMIEVGGLRERVERIVEVDVDSFAEKYSGFLSVEQVAREYFVNTSTVNDWIRKGKIKPTASFVFGAKRIHLFSQEDVVRYRLELGLKEHTEETIRDDFFEFLAERDYTFSYKMIFLLGFLERMDAVGDARLEGVLDYYAAFYRERIERGLPAERTGCPYTLEFLADQKCVKRSMLDNPFEKFERKRFFYHSKDLGVISMNHALKSKLTKQDYAAIRQQMQEDLEAYYRDRVK